MRSQNANCRASVSDAGADAVSQKRPTILAVSQPIFRGLLIAAISFGTFHAANAAEDSLGTKIKKIFATPTPAPRKHRKRSPKKATPSPSPTASPKRKKVSPTPSPSPTSETKRKHKRNLRRQELHPKKARSQAQPKLQALPGRRVPVRKKKA